MSCQSHHKLITLFTTWITPRNSTNSHKSSAEMKQDGLGTSAWSITTRITDFNKAIHQQGWEKLVLRDSNYRYYINPDYYT